MKQGKRELTADSYYIIRQDMDAIIDTILYAAKQKYGERSMRRVSTKAGLSIDALSHANTCRRIPLEHLILFCHALGLEIVLQEREER
jgi:lambda repressor-like predicted transcriptional regulator